MLYFRVIGGIIVSGPIELPTTWTDPATGINYDMTNLASQDLIELGWYQLNPDPTQIRDLYDTIEDQSYVVNGTVVDEVITLAPLSLSDTIAQKTIMISSFHNEWMDGTFSWNGDTWNGDEQSRQNLTGMTSAIANGVPIPAGFVWTNAAGTPVPMTGAELVAMGASMLGWVNSCYQTKYYHTAQISAMTDQNQIIAYDHTLGWPT